MKNFWNLWKDVALLVCCSSSLLMSDHSFWDLNIVLRKGLTRAWAGWTSWKLTTWRFDVDTRYSSLDIDMKCLPKGLMDWKAIWESGSLKPLRPCFPLRKSREGNIAKGGPGRDAQLPNTSHSWYSSPLRDPRNSHGKRHPGSFTWLGICKSGWDFEQMALFWDVLETLSSGNQLGEVGH